MSTVPKIFVFADGPQTDTGRPYAALAEDGTLLGEHFCSGDGWAQRDLGVLEGENPDQHVTYANHYSDGYEMEFVPPEDSGGHDGLLRAIKLHRAQAPHDNDLVTVCDNCRRACCWHGYFMCDGSDIAGTVEMPISELKKLDLESSHYWKMQ